MLNLVSLLSASIWKPEESDCQRFNVKLGSNLITIRGIVLNLTAICQRCSVNMTTVVKRPDPTDTETLRRYIYTEQKNPHVYTLSLSTENIYKIHNKSNINKYKNTCKRGTIIRTDMKTVTPCSWNTYLDCLLYTSPSPRDS